MSTTNDDLAAQIATLRKELERAPDTLAAIIHAAIVDHETRVQHSGVSPTQAAESLAQIAQQAQLGARIVELIEGPYELDWKGNPVLQREKGLLARLERIEKQTNGGVKLSRTERVSLWGTFGAALAAVAAQIFGP